MTETLLIAIVVVLALVAGFLILVLLEMRKAFKELGVLIGTVEGTVKPTMQELNETMKSMREMSENINAISGDLRRVTSAVGDLGKNIDEVNKLIEDIPLRVSGIRAGIRAALESLLLNLFSRR